jgi:hypothetical protein
MATTTSAKKLCPECRGEIEQVTLRGGAMVERCSSCGRGMDGNGIAPSRVSMPGKPCSVDGCPGRIDTSGQCPCCVKRARWAEEHTPKRKCEICEGDITGRGGRKLCGACKPIRQRAAVAKHYNGKAKKAVRA